MSKLQATCVVLASAFAGAALCYVLTGRPTAPEVLEGTDATLEQKVTFASFKTTYNLMDYVSLTPSFTRGKELVKPDDVATSIVEYIATNDKNWTMNIKTASQTADHKVEYNERITGAGVTVADMDKLNPEQRANFTRLISLNQTILDKVPDQYTAQNVKSVDCLKRRMSKTMDCVLTLK